MINFKKSLNISLLVTALLASNAFANYTISPLKLNITPEEKITSLSFTNNDEQDSKNFQVTVYQVHNEHGQEVSEETKDLIATPRTFKLGPKMTQLIRVGSRNASMVKNVNYKLSIKELPVNKVIVKGQHLVQMLHDYRVPVVIKSTSRSEEETQ